MNGMAKKEVIFFVCALFIIQAGLDLLLGGMQGMFFTFGFLVGHNVDTFFNDKQRTRLANLIKLYDIGLSLFEKQPKPKQDGNIVEFKKQ